MFAGDNFNLKIDDYNFRHNNDFRFLRILLFCYFYMKNLVLK